jgi:hypothetical protein
MNRRGTSPVRLTALVASVACSVAGVTFTGVGEARAEGRFVDLHGEVMVGAMTGRGSDKAAPDFFHQTQGPGFGVELGVRLLVLDLSVRFIQMVGSDGREGTLTLLPMFGPSLEIPLQKGDSDLLGKRRPPKLVLRPGVAAGFGFGTPAPVHGALSADQISAKGLIVMGRCGVERFFGPFVGLEAHIEGGYHYLLGGEGVVNGASASDHSQGWQLGAFGGVVLHLGI